MHKGKLLRQLSKRLAHRQYIQRFAGRLTKRLTNHNWVNSAKKVPTAYTIGTFFRILVSPDLFFN
ncbi:hypothetical protein CGZ75_12905 [Paenibacillus herberti]|uniref:Uncharacterized protein n=1 Tax=Paenibacillus herberti TaxID=1619309 RepID=A0A229NVG4_9BACL|nr:hypothetical protein CGZ75_12905 [Paenibacillus herberti]